MKKGGGFTLIELLIVVGLLGILTAIAIVNIQNYRTRAQANACIVNLKSIDSHVSLWAIDYGKSGGDSVSMSNLVPLYLKSTPYCPLDSAKEGYILTTVTQKPQCPRDPEHHKIE